MKEKDDSALGVFLLIVVFGVILLVGYLGFAALGTVGRDMMLNASGTKTEGLPVYVYVLAVIGIIFFLLTLGGDKKNETK